MQNSKRLNWKHVRVNTTNSCQKEEKHISLKIRCAPQMTRSFLINTITKVEFLFINRHMLCLYFAIKRDPFANLTLSRVIPVEEKVEALFSIRTLTTIGWLPVLAPLVPPPAQTRFQMSSPRLPTILTGLEKTLDWRIWVVRQEQLDLELEL